MSSKKRQETTYGYKKCDGLANELAGFAISDKTPCPEGLDSLTIEDQLFDSIQSYFMGQMRAVTDRDRDMRQAIGYMLPVTLNEAGEIDMVFVYARAAGSDVNLEGLLSIGIGGHVETEDLECGTDGVVDTKETIYNSMAREFNEELHAKLYHALNPVFMGCVCENHPDNPNYVGNTHIGFIYSVDVGNGWKNVGIKDVRYTSVGWHTLEELEAMVDRFEPWSQYVIKNLL